MTSQNSFRITGCRICGEPGLVEVGSLGAIAISDFSPEPLKGPSFPLELVHCPNCGLLQLAHNTPRDLLYGNYWYRSGLNKAIVEDLKGIAQQVQGEVHIDIGANDGTLLKHSPATRKIAVDPSNIKPAGFKWVRDYFEDVRLDVQADTITAVACLYDLPDPNAFMTNIRTHLAGDGIFIAQLMTLQPMIENNDVGNICHEHLEYYSYASLVELYEQNGLEIFRVERNDMNGGSYRLFARHLRKGSIKVDEPRYTIDDLKAFMERIDDNKQRFLAWLGDRDIVGYGASTKMGTITQYYGVSPEVVVDVNPDKLGKYTNTGSLIVAKIPDGTQDLWVFPYGFLEYFRQKEADYKGSWVTTMPEFNVWT